MGGAAVKGGYHLGSLYLISRIGVMAEANQNILDEAAARISLIKGPWAIGGDFNCTPAELVKSGWLKMVGGVIFRPEGSTCNLGEKRTLDFFVVRPALNRTSWGL